MSDQEPVTVTAASRLSPAERTGKAFQRMTAFLDQRVTPLEAPLREGVQRMIARVPRPALRDAVSAGGWTTPLRAGFRRNLVATYRSRAAERPGPAPLRALLRAPLAPSPAIPSPAVNWMPIGPSVLRRGQAGNRPAVSGRVDGIAIATGGQRVYVASANGGVWRSDDGGLTWWPTMDALESQPGALPSDSLACGAIAIDPTTPDHVFVGTGEPFGALDSYFGVGPLVTTDGGQNWNREAADVNSPPLDGTGFFRLSVDPTNPDRVVAATRNGLYRREPDGQGFVWVRKRGGVATSVVSAAAAATCTFFAALTPGGVFTSTDGDTWNPVGTGFPASTGVVALAVRPDNPFPVYALVVAPDTSQLMTVLRLDQGDGPWQPVTQAPADLFGDPSKPGQGWYDAAIAVAPDDESLLFMGGGANPQYEGASFYRCRVAASGTPPDIAYSMQSEWIGSTVHADIHALEFTPGNPAELWIGCDGGVFTTAAAPTVETFQPRNTGLATVTMNHLAIHPSEDGVLFCGVQDNGTVRYVSSEAWLHSAAGDGGYAVIHPANPYRVLRTYIYNALEVTSDGGRDYTSWSPANVPIPVDNKGSLAEAVEFYAPLACSPEGLCAFGAQRPWISDFGSNWSSIPTGDAQQDLLEDSITALFFASASTLYAGLKAGGVYRYDLADGIWTRNMISRPPLLTGAAITSIAVDPSDPTGNSTYICFGGGPNDYRHVWHYDGANWEARSGPGQGMPASLLAIQHNALVTDPNNPNHIYAAADLGVWRSTDGGRNWSKFADGLPEAPVLDLKLHPARRILWAATHGRGVFERAIDGTGAPPAELWIRDTLLDTGRRPSMDALPDPTDPGHTVTHTDSPDIKLDTPAPDGSYQTGSTIDFFEFEDGLQDRSSSLPAAAAAGVSYRVFVQVHNRSRTPADTRVMLLLGPAAGPMDALPPNYDVNVQNGNPIATPHWNTVATVGVTEITAGVPQIAAFEVLASVLAAAGAVAGGNLRLLALVHSDADPFVSAVTDIDPLVLGERKAAEKMLTFI